MASKLETGDVVTVTVTFNAVDLNLPLVPYPANGRVTQSAEARVETVPDRCSRGVLMARRARTRRFHIRRRDERGAMALLMAGTMTLLVIVAAMGVDLGNAWQRKITVQKSVDVSAISAGHLLPKTSTNADAIYTEVANYLNKPSNRRQRPTNQRPPPSFMMATWSTAR